MGVSENIIPKPPFTDIFFSHLKSFFKQVLNISIIYYDSFSLLIQHTWSDITIHFGVMFLVNLSSVFTNASFVITDSGWKYLAPNLLNTQLFLQSGH